MFTCANVSRAVRVRSSRLLGSGFGTVTVAFRGLALRKIACVQASSGLFRLANHKNLPIMRCEL